MKIGDIVKVINCESIPQTFLGNYGIVKDVNDYKVTVEFKGFVEGIGGLCHTALPSDLKKVGEQTEKVEELERRINKVLEKCGVPWINEILEGLSDPLPYPNTFTFDEFVEYGRNMGVPLHGNGEMPWSFIFIGYPVTHENDQCYLISTTEGFKKFTPRDVITITADSMIQITTNSK